MLMAGTPFVVCRCPNGDIKLSTFAKPSSSDDACCIAGANGAPSHSRPGAKSCCARKNGAANDHGKPSHDKDWPQGPAFENLSCQKTLAQVKGSSLSRPETKPVEPSLEGLNPVIGVVALQSARASIPGCAVDGAHRLPPPTDLVISLQRLTI